jgi:hypothetical protein
VGSMYFCSQGKAHSKTVIAGGAPNG